MNVKALLLAAGYGSRLKPLTNEWPKCLMPIGQRPLLEYWLETLWQNNIHEVLVNLHYLSEIVKGYLERPRFRDWVKYVYEPNLLGTAGTLRQNYRFFSNCSTLLIHADNWCQCNFYDFLHFHENNRPDGTSITMMTFQTENAEKCGIVECDEKGVVIAFHEKKNNPPSNLANAAVYILEPDVLIWLNQNPQITDFSTEVLPAWIGRIATWHNSIIHRDIGTLPVLSKAQQDPRPQLVWPEIDHWQNNFLKNSIHETVTIQGGECEESKSKDIIF